MCYISFIREKPYYQCLPDLISIGSHNQIILKKKLSQYLLHKLKIPITVIYLQTNALLGEPRTSFTAFVADQASNCHVWLCLFCLFVIYAKLQYVVTCLFLIFLKEEPLIQQTIQFADYASFQSFYYYRLQACHVLFLIFLDVIQ